MSEHQRILPARIRITDRVTPALRAEGVVPLSRLARLQAVVSTDESLPPIAVSMFTERAENRGICLKGHLIGTLSLRCERCLRPLNWPFDIELGLRVVYSGAEARRLLNHCDPLLLEDDWLPVHALIEDEIMLALPMMPMHESGDCAQPGKNPVE